MSRKMLASEVAEYLRRSRVDAPVQVGGCSQPTSRTTVLVRLAERYDIAVMSTKGMSVVAARMLVDELCGRHGIPLLALHDFDKAGFSILGSLRRDNRRYHFRHRVEVIDLGLRLADTEACGLEAEDDHITDKQKVRDNLGATAQRRRRWTFCSQAGESS